MWWWGDRAINAYAIAYKYVTAKAYLNAKAYGNTCTDCHGGAANANCCARGGYCSK